jgi:hypothetical protein
MCGDLVVVVSVAFGGVHKISGSERIAEPGWEILPAPVSNSHFGHRCGMASSSRPESEDFAKVSTNRTALSRLSFPMQKGGFLCMGRMQAPMVAFLRP